MGWTDVGSKVGRLILDSSQPLLNHLHRASDKPPKVRAPDSPPIPSQPGAESEEPEPPCSSSSRSEFDGPDTSSLSAFLYSFLSPTHQRGEDDGRSRAAWESSDESIETQQQEQQQRNSLARDGERDWFVSSGSDLDKSIMEDYMSSFNPEAEPATSIKLPALSEHSSLLSESLQRLLYSSLPRFMHDLHWILLYSTARDGISLLTLYRKSSLIPGPCLLVAGDTKGAVFGGLLTAPLKPSRKKYQGSNQTFVFTNISGQPKVFPATGMNRYYYLCTNEALAIGGGGHFALYLDCDLLTGSSGACETFGNCCLAHSEEFGLKEVELWGFAYNASKF